MIIKSRNNNAIVSIKRPESKIISQPSPHTYIDGIVEGVSNGEESEDLKVGQEVVFFYKGQYEIQNNKYIINQEDIVVIKRG